MRSKFESGGWAIIHNFLDEIALGALAAALDEALLAPRPSCTTRPGNDLIPLRWDDAIVARILGATERMQRLRNVLNAEDLKWLSGYISIKTAHSPALWWHQDWWCWDHPISLRRPATQVAVLCYLTDTNEVNGALRVLPGSHHTSTPLHALLPEPHGEHASSLPIDHPAMTDWCGQVTLPVRAGDAIVLDYRLLHGTHANDTPLRRDCILLSFIPDWRGLPDEIKGHLIMHPAQPDASEVQFSQLAGHADLLPTFAGRRTSLTVNRVAPAMFGAGA